MRYKIILLLALLFSIISCDKDSDTTKRNLWIKDVMENVYLWEADIPDGLNPDSYSDSYQFFKKFIYEDDKWSWLSEDYYATKNLYNGISTTGGHEYSLYYREDNVHIEGHIEYVQKNSPAESAGIKRGDIFTRINNISLSKTNYYELLTSYNSYVIGFDTLVNDSLIPLKDINITEVEGFEDDPILIDTTFIIGGKKIGYLHYTNFYYRYENNSSYNEDSAALETTFKHFAAEGITDLVLDLRYNGGGSVTAEIYLSNLIAPTSQVGEIFKKAHWNEFYTNYFTDKYGEEFFNTRIEDVVGNLNMTGKICALVSSSTASASEALLNGLEPLCDMTLIGDTTHGKFTGMIVFPDDDSIWAVIPIVVKSTNKNDVSVKGGMKPDIILNDNPTDGYQLGDIRETMLAAAIREITGVAVPRKTPLPSFEQKRTLGRFKNGEKIKPFPNIIGWGNDVLIE